MLAVLRITVPVEAANVVTAAVKSDVPRVDVVTIVCIPLALVSPPDSSSGWTGIASLSTGVSPSIIRLTLHYFVVYRNYRKLEMETLCTFCSFFLWSVYGNNRNFFFIVHRLILYVSKIRRFCQIQKCLIKMVQHTKKYKYEFTRF